MPSSPRLTLSRRLSREETYHLADTARRKSSDKFVREDLRLMLGHVNILEQILQDIALNEPKTTKSRPSSPPSPTRSAVKPQPVKNSAIQDEVDEFGFRYDDDGEEDMEELVLTKTRTRGPNR